MHKTHSRPQGYDTPFRIRETRIDAKTYGEDVVEYVMIRLEYAAGWHEAVCFVPAGTSAQGGLLVSDGTRLILTHGEPDGFAAPIEIVGLEGPSLRHHGSIESLAAACSQTALVLNGRTRTTDRGVVLCQDSTRVAEDHYNGRRPIASDAAFAKAVDIMVNGMDPDRLVYSVIDGDLLASARKVGFVDCRWGSLASALYIARKGFDEATGDLLFLAAPLSSVRPNAANDQDREDRWFAVSKERIDEGVVVIGDWDDAVATRRVA